MKSNALNLPAFRVTVRAAAEGEPTSVVKPIYKKVRREQTGWFLIRTVVLLAQCSPSLRRGYYLLLVIDNCDVAFCTFVHSKTLYERPGLSEATCW